MWENTKQGYALIETTTGVDYFHCGAGSAPHRERMPGSKLSAYCCPSPYALSVLDLFDLFQAPAWLSDQIFVRHLIFLLKKCLHLKLFLCDKGWPVSALKNITLRLEHSQTVAL